MEQKLVKESLNEDMGGVSAPMATLNNTPGMGTATPPSTATGGVGSGDNWGNSIKKKPYTQAARPKITTKKKKVVSLKKRPKTPKLAEENTNPINDATEIGKLMKGSKTTPFKKGKEKKNQNSVVQKKFEHEILSLEEFKKLNETS
jgi:hypothetical protein